MEKEEIIIIGGGPCGMAAAIACQEKGYNPLIIEKGNIVQSIYNYPTHQQFFSSSEKLEIGEMPFVIEDRKPKRNQALAYYREVAKRKALRIRSFENVTEITRQSNGAETRFHIKAENVTSGHESTFEANHIIIATGYYNHPNYMNIPGEDLPKVHHYFKEAHPYYDCDALVIGGKNSAVDTAMELHKVGARVTVIYRGNDYSPSVKPWILPEFQSLVRNGHVEMLFNTEAIEINQHSVIVETDGIRNIIPNDVVFAMTGYHPDFRLFEKAGLKISKDSGCPIFNPNTMETNIPNAYIAGVIAAGNDANKIFIENGRFHGGKIAESIADKKVNI